MMDSGDQFGVGVVFREYGEHLAAEGEVKELLRGTTRLINWTLFWLGFCLVGQLDSIFAGSS